MYTLWKHANASRREMMIPSFHSRSMNQKTLLKRASTFYKNAWCSIAYLRKGISNYTACSQHLVLPFAVKSFLYPNSSTRNILQNCNTSVKQQTAIFQGKIQRENFKLAFRNVWENSSLKSEKHVGMCQNNIPQAPDEKFAFEQRTL